MSSIFSAAGTLKPEVYISKTKVYKFFLWARSTVCKFSIYYRALYAVFNVFDTVLFQFNPIRVTDNCLCKLLEVAC